VSDARPRKLTNEPPPQRDGRVPYDHWDAFNVHGNDDGTFQITAVAGDGRYVFADRFTSVEEAEWACGLFNAAIGYEGRGTVGR
jgi:hypothetical protein